MIRDTDREECGEEDGVAASTGSSGGHRPGRRRPFRWRRFAKGLLIGLGVYVLAGFALDLLSLPPIAVGLLAVAAGTAAGTPASGVERTPNGYVIVGGSIVLVLALITWGLWWLAGTTLAGRMVGG